MILVYSFITKDNILLYSNSIRNQQINSNGKDNYKKIVKARRLLVIPKEHFSEVKVNVNDI